MFENILFEASAILGVFIVLTVVIFLVRQALIEPKRRMRKAELKRHILALRDESGCEYAYTHLIEALHISEHYGILLSEIGFEGGPTELCKMAHKSLGKYIACLRLKINETWALKVVPDELGICIPIAENCDGYEAVQLYGQALRKLKRLERQHTCFLTRTHSFFENRPVFFKTRLKLA